MTSDGAGQPIITSADDTVVTSDNSTVEEEAGRAGMQ
jgi:hypothetical protein